PAAFNIARTHDDFSIRRDSVTITAQRAARQVAQSGENATGHVQPFCCRPRLATSSPLSAAHTLRSKAPTATILPSGEKATAPTRPPCPRSANFNSWVKTVHKKRRLLPTAANVLPSGENATAATAPAGPFRITDS